MVKNNIKKITNNDDFPPLPASPTTTKISTPRSTGQEQESAWTIVRSRKGKSVSPTAHTNSTAKSLQYKNAVKTKTAKSPKRPKPSSPTDHSTVTKRKPNPAVKIKQEFIDRVDITKGLAPIFGSTNGKSLEAGNVASKDKHCNSQDFDADAYKRSHSLTKRNDRVYRRVVSEADHMENVIVNRTVLRCD